MRNKSSWQNLREAWVLIKPQRIVLLVGLLLVAINRGAGLIGPASTKYLLDNVFFQRQTHLLKPLVGIVFLAAIVQGLTAFATTHLLSKAAQKLITDLSKRVQEHVGRLPLAYYDRNKTGALVSRIMNDVEGIRHLIGTDLAELAGGLITAGIALAYLFHVSPRLTLVACSTLAAFAVMVSKGFQRMRPMFHERFKINAEVTGRLTESLGGVRVVKGYHAEKREADVFSVGSQKLLRNVLKSITATSAMTLATSLLMGSITAAILLMGAHQVIEGTMTPGTFVSYTIFLALLIGPVFLIVNYGTELTEALTGLERTREILNEKPEDETTARDTALGRIEGHVVFENVYFAYDGAKSVLHGLCFETKPGTVTALVGPSGAGKSTVIGLVAAFYTPTRGCVRVDGKDLATARLDTYRTQLGVVLQEMFLFDGTIRENVAFGRPAASEDEVRAACRVARVDEFAEIFERGYETVVGERGIKLSGGQKQRISIARAILADPRILILDEATSSLDSESEALIQEGLGYLMSGRTTFVIAHRLSTIRSANQILVMEAGRTIEQGTHESLYAARGRYYNLYVKQHGIESNLFLAPGEGGTEPERLQLNLRERTDNSLKEQGPSSSIGLVRSLRT